MHVVNTFDLNHIAYIVIWILHNFTFVTCRLCDFLTDETTNVKIDPNRTVYQLGDSLNCTADGNPSPTYQWKNLVTGTITQGPELGLLRSFVRTEQWFFQCSAFNDVSGRVSTVSKNISFIVTDQSMLHYTEQSMLHYYLNWFLHIANF